MDPDERHAPRPHEPQMEDEVSYRAGTYGLESIGIKTDTPHILCDGCKVRRDVTNPRSMGPYAWLLELDNKPAPGWKLVRQEDPFVRKDYCPACKGDAP